MCPSGRAGFHGQSTEIWAAQTKQRKDEQKRNRAGKRFDAEGGALTYGGTCPFLYAEISKAAMLKCDEKVPMK